MKINFNCLLLITLNNYFFRNSKIMIKDIAFNARLKILEMPLKESQVQSLTI